MIVLYVFLAIFLEILFVSIAAYAFEFWTNFMLLRKAGIKVPLKGLIVVLSVALFFFVFFHINVIVFTFLVLE